MSSAYDEWRAELARIRTEQAEILGGEMKRYTWRDGRWINMTRRWFEILQAKASHLEKCIALET